MTIQASAKSDRERMDAVSKVKEDLQAKEGEIVALQRQLKQAADVANSQKAKIVDQKNAMGQRAQVLSASLVFVLFCFGPVDVRETCLLRAASYLVGVSVRHPRSAVSSSFTPAGQLPHLWSRVCAARSMRGSLTCGWARAAL